MIRFQSKDEGNIEMSWFLKDPPDFNEHNVEHVVALYDAAKQFGRYESA